MLFEAVEFFFVPPAEPEQFRKIEKRIFYIAVNRKRFSQQGGLVIISSGAHKEAFDFRMGGEKFLDQPVGQIESGGKFIKR